MTNAKSSLTTWGDCLAAMAAYAGGSVPSSATADYSNWFSWLVRAQEDACKRAHWSRLLTKTTIEWDAGDTEVDLPDNFFKRNGIYVFDVDGVDWNSANNTDKQMLMVVMDAETAKWKVLFNGFTPDTDGSAEMWYFFLPPVPTFTSDKEDDPIYLDGEMIVFGGLKEYFRKARQPGSQDDARIEYENRFRESLQLDNLPNPQELMSFQYPARYRVNEKSYYYSGRGS
jgi:hypothetical protein